MLDTSYPPHCWTQWPNTVVYAATNAAWYSYWAALMETHDKGQAPTRRLQSAVDESHMVCPGSTCQCCGACSTGCPGWRRLALVHILLYSFELSGGYCSHLGGPLPKHVPFYWEWIACRLNRAIKFAKISYNVIRFHSFSGIQIISGDFLQSCMVSSYF